MNKSLLIHSSCIYNNSSILDRLIYIKSNPPQNEIKDLLLESFWHFIDIDDVLEMRENLNLILECVKQLLDKTLFSDCLNEIFIHSMENGKLAIVLSEIIFWHENKLIDFDEKREMFLFKSYNQIVSQIQSLQNEELVIFNNKISDPFKDMFITNILCLSKLDDTSIQLFYDYFFHKKAVNFEQMIRFPLELFSKFIPLMSKDEFIQFLQYTIKTSKKDQVLTHSVLTHFLDKLITLNIELNDFELILNSITPFDMTEPVWKYFSNFNVTLPETLANDIKEFPNPEAAIKIMPNQNNIPIDVIVQYLLNCNDFNEFEPFLNEETIIHHTFSTVEFWNHISSMPNENTQCSDDMLIKIAKLFMLNIEKEKTFETIKEMIKYNFPLTNEKIDFIYKLLDNLDDDYRQNYFDSDKKLYEEIIDSETIPLPSFWRLFDFSHIKCFKNNIFTLIASQFSQNKEDMEVTMKIKNFDQNLISEYIQKRDIDYMINMDRESLKFIAYAMIYDNQELNQKIYGLTKDNILPFMATALISINDQNKDKLFEISDNALKILKSSCQQLINNQSSLQIVSINGILSNIESISDDIIFTIFNNLLPHIFSDIYKGDIINIMLAIFNISSKKEIKYDIKRILVSYQNEIFEFIIHNMHNVKQFQELKENKMDLAVFNKNKISKIISKSLHNSSDLIVMNTIKFIDQFSNDFPKLSFTKHYKRISQILKELINEEKWEDVEFMATFIKKRNLDDLLLNFIGEPIPFGIKFKVFDYDDLLDNSADATAQSIINDFEINRKSVIAFLVNMNEDISNKSRLYSIILDKYYGQTVDPITLLQSIPHIYDNDTEFFNEIIQKLFIYNSECDKLIRKQDINPNKSNMFQSRRNLSIISKLLDAASETENYQAFFCLANTVLCFPFLFENDPHKIFNAVNKNLENISLYYTIKDEKNIEDIRKLKTAISALFFLHKSLYSITIINSFINWFYENIRKFTISQILGLTYILICLFQTEELQTKVFSISIKYDFHGIMRELLEKNVPEEIEIYYKYNIYSLIFYFNQVINESSKTKMIYIDELSKLANPFTNTFNNHLTIHPVKIKIFKFLKQPISVINDFMNNVSWNIYPTFFSSKQIRNVTQSQVNTFLTLFNSSPIEKSPQIIDYNMLKNEKIIRYLARQQDWVYDWFIYNCHFPLSPEQSKIISNAINEINAININELENSEAIYCNNFLVNEPLIIKIFNDFIQIFDKLLIMKDIVLYITQKNENMKALINYCDSYISQIDDQKIDTFLHTTKLLLIISDNESFKCNFKEKQICNLLNTGLKCSFRTNASILLNISKILLNVDSKCISSSSTHLIIFLLELNDFKYIQSALNLCQKIGIQKIFNVIQFIKNIFNQNFKDKNHLVISCFLEKLPEVAYSKKSEIIDLLKTLINYYNQNNPNNEEMNRLICLTFNFLSPKINDMKPLNQIDFSDDKSCIRKAPLEIIKIDPEFWNLYNENISTLNNIIINDEKMIEYLRFLFDYPKLISFQVRYSYFIQKIKKYINLKKYTFIDVKRSDILSTSYNEFEILDEDQWFNKIIIEFIDEKGVDQGGLTSEWFTLLLKEIFDSNTGLFQSSDNNTYLPRPSIKDKEKRIKYFTFAGKILALLIMNGQNVNVHLTNSFCKQIFSKEITFDDMNDFDSDIYSSFQKILKNDVDELELNFTIDIIENGEYKNINLKENGENIYVTNENKKEYVDLYAKYHLEESIKNEIKAFCNGFNSIIPNDELYYFSPNELNLIICGNSQIDINDMKNNTEYEHPYHENHPVCQMFFNVISKWNKENLSKLMIFMTGSSQIPVNGFNEYKKQNVPIKIIPGGDRNYLCSSHTCMHYLHLPMYENEIEMNDKLIQSINEGTTFAMQ